jgi:ornithine cyclodeaminase/alanine dehydrogenase-like protein (mu-crystallin family)
MQEVSGDLIKRASLILVDSVDACRAEAGELILAGWDDIKNRVVEIGAFSHDEITRPHITSRDITIFKSVGVGVQDVALAALVTRLAEEGSIGTSIPF